VQQTPLQGWVGPHAVVHLWDAGSQALPDGQSAALLQPQPPRTQARPLGFALQSTHCPPLPQALGAVPSWQVPLEAELQHPELQGVEAEHWLMQSLPVQPLAPLGQSAMLPQPHWPAMHLWPLELAVQSPHTAPAFPQAPSAVPAVQVPPVADVQQPPLQGLSLSQAAPHVCVFGLHALPAAQSALERQPHAPFTQAWPAAFVVQSRQAPPVLPHWLGLSPGLQEPAAQQPPWHFSWLGHFELHFPPTHACPTAQSP
jgi:hypothetical protein